MLKALIDLNGLHKQFAFAQGVLENTLGTPVCIPGCGRCCTVKTSMIIEAINMVSTLTGLARLKAAVDCAENWLLEKTAIAANEMALSYKGLPVGIVPPDIKQEWEQVSRSRCPFLTEEAKCLIYECRPLLCMALGVTRGIEYCPRPIGIGENSTRRGLMDSNELAPSVQAFKEYCGRKPEWRIYGFTPTLLYRAAEPDKFRAMVDENRIPSCKIIGTELDINLMWQPQADAIRDGENPDNVAYAWTTKDPQETLKKLRRNGEAHQLGNFITTK